MLEGCRRSFRINSSRDFSLNFPPLDLCRAELIVTFYFEELRGHDNKEVCGVMLFE